MTILWINLAIVFICAFFSRYFSTPVITTNNIIISVKPNKLFVLFVALCLIMVSGLRNNIGDTFFYMHDYELKMFTWEMVKTGKDIGFGFLQMVLQMFSDDAQILVFTTAVITNALIVFVLFKYSRMLELSIFVYITGGLYLISMNGIRQFLAAAIIFLATKYLIEGNWLKYFIVVIFASTFHQSALILIPIFFLVRFKAWSKTTFILIFLAVIFVIGFDQFTTIIFSAIENTQYGHYKDFNEGGANILRVLIDAVPLLIAYLGRDKLRVLFPESDYIVNMALLGLVFMIISTQNWIFARFTIYFNLYQLILISWLIKLFKEKDQKLVYFGILICYFVFYFYETVITLGIQYRSNYLMF